MEELNFALVYCEGGFNTTNGKTAHGLVRFTARFKIAAVIDSGYQGEDSGIILDGIPNGIPIIGGLEEGLLLASRKGIMLKSFIIGLAPDGGRLPPSALPVIKRAIKSGLDVYNGLHDFLSESPELVKSSQKYGCRLFDIRKPADSKSLHFFSGKIEEVHCPRIAMLGTDSAVGKRTTAWGIVHSIRNQGYKAELIGTGQTAWLQGAKYSIIMDSLVNDFVSGEIENAIHTAWTEVHPDVLVLEGQGSLLNPAYPGGFELLAAGRPNLIILQHAPRRTEYDGFPGYRLHPLDHQIRAVEIISGKKVSAITLNHEHMNRSEIQAECLKIEKETGIPVFDVLECGADELIQRILPHIRYEYTQLGTTPVL